MMFTCFAVTSSVIPFENAPVTEFNVWSICDELGANWRDLGTVLGLRSALMENIGADHTKCRNKAWEVLLKWKQEKGKGATVGILLDALNKMRRNDVVEKLLGMQSLLVKEISQH